MLLYEQAATDLSLDLGRSYTIGDSLPDVEAARRFGGTGCLVRTGWAAQAGILESARGSAAFVGGSIVEVADWILHREKTAPG